MAHDKKGKYARELEKIRQMRALNNMVAKGDIENTLLQGGSKESEPVSDTVVDSILDRLQQSERSGKDMELVDKLAASSEVSPTPRRRSAAAQSPRRRASQRKLQTRSKARKSLASRLARAMSWKRRQARKTRTRRR